MGVGPSFPIPVVNEVSCRIAQQSNSVTLRHSLMLCRCALESLCQYFPFCEFKQVSSWTSMFSSRKGVNGFMVIMCAQSLAQKKWSTSDYYYKAYFPIYYNICLFLFFFSTQVWAAWEQICLSDLLLVHPQYLEQCLTHNKNLLNEWTFQMSRWTS